jgi:hypothetical protein
MPLIKRRRLFVDSRVQGAILLRIGLYWFSGLLAICQIVLLLDVMRNPGRPFFDQFRISVLSAQCAPAVIASVLILPLVLYDILNLTNRFTGPIYRLRRAMRELATDEHVAPLRFRDGDFWQEVAQEFNAIAERQDELKRQVVSAVARHDSANKSARLLENTAVD